MAHYRNCFLTRYLLTLAFFIVSFTVKGADMDKYFLLENDPSALCYITQSRGDITPPLGYIDEDGVANSKISPFLAHGKTWPGDASYPVFTYDFSRIPCSLVNITGQDAITEEMKEVMEAFDVAAQFFEIGITVKGKRYTGTTYYRIHHLKPLRFIDLNASDITMKENDEPEYFEHGRIMAIRKLKIKPEVLEGVDLFTYSGNSVLRTYTFMSERLKESLEELKLDGVKFVAMEDIRASEGGFLEVK